MQGALSEALKAYEDLLQLYPQSGRARYGRAQSLDQLSNQQQSNALLEQCIGKVTPLQKEKVFLITGYQGVPKNVTTEAFLPFFFPLVG